MKPSRHKSGNYTRRSAVDDALDDGSLLKLVADMKLGALQRLADGVDF